MADGYGRHCRHCCPVVPSYVGIWDSQYRCCRHCCPVHSSVGRTADCPVVPSYVGMADGYDRHYRPLLPMSALRTGTVGIAVYLALSALRSVMTGNVGTFVPFHVCRHCGQTLSALLSFYLALSALRAVMTGTVGIVNDSVMRDRLVGLVVKASASRVEDPGFKSRLRRDFSGVESYLWLKNWRSSGYPARRLALQGQCWDWSARCQYTMTGCGGKFGLQLLFQCGSM